LDTAVGTEFQRADCAPRSTLGNGAISITDWVQAGRYATGIDPLTPIGGPLAEPLARKSSKSDPKVVGEGAGDLNRIVILETTNQVGQSSTVFTRLVAQGDENAMGFSVAFDPTVLTFASATNGGNAAGALLNVNTNRLNIGRVGIALSLSVGSKFPAGTQEVIKLTFLAAPSATGTTPLTFTDTPIFREVSDITATALPTAYTGVNLVLSVPGPLLSITKSPEGLVLSWPASATNFVLESSSDVSTNWTGITIPLITNGQSINAALPVTEQQQFFRLKK
jgi:hypothetical protein